MKDLIIIFILFIIVIMFGCIVGFFALKESREVSDEYHRKMNAICAPSFFVEAERAADHLTRIKCLSEQGEKKEILIKGETK